VGPAGAAEPQLGGLHDAPLLGRGDARRGSAEAAVPAQAYLDEDDAVAVEGDEVHLAAAEAHVAGQDAQPVGLQVGGREGFGGLAPDEVGGLRRGGVAPTIGLRRFSSPCLPCFQHPPMHLPPRRSPERRHCMSLPRRWGISMT
jgi:hypothetical protein